MNLCFRREAFKKLSFCQQTTGFELRQFQFGSKRFFPDNFGIVGFHQQILKFLKVIRFSQKNAKCIPVDVFSKVQLDVDFDLVTSFHRLEFEVTDTFDLLVFIRSGNYDHPSVPWSRNTRVEVVEFNLFSCKP
jgi:hypothetical protein